MRAPIPPESSGSPAQYLARSEGRAGVRQPSAPTEGVVFTSCCGVFACIFPLDFSKYLFRDFETTCNVYLSIVSLGILLNMKEASLSAVQTLLVVAALLSLSPCARVADARFISTNPVKEKLFDGGVVYGAFLTIPSYKAVENVAQDGRLDFVWLEAEHTEWGAAEAQEMVVTLTQ